MTADELITRLGGVAAVAARLGVQPSAVSNWRRRGIPARFWLPMQRVAAAAGLDWHPPAPAPAPVPESAPEMRQ